MSGTDSTAYTYCVGGDLLGPRISLIHPPPLVIRISGIITSCYSGEAVFEDEG